MDVLTRYLGLDWLAVSFGLVAIYQIGDHKKRGFIFYILSALFSLAFAIAVKSIPFMLANIVTIVLQIRAYLKWAKNENKVGLRNISA
jgi:hypothetical protein